MFDLTRKLRGSVMVAALLGGLLIGGFRPAPALAQGVDAACMLNGSPLLPSGSGDVSWAFLANFNHAASSVASKSCVVVRSYGVVSYAVGNYCLWRNNNPPISAGGGSVTFNGVGYLHCDAPIPAVMLTPEFRTIVNASWPSKANVVTYTFASGDDVNFSAQVDTTCLVTLNSRYDDIAFSHATQKLCGSYNRYTSIMRQNNTGGLPAGLHRVQTSASNTSYGPTSDSGFFELPSRFVVDLGMNSANLSLDWILFDPGGECCAPK